MLSVVVAVDEAGGIGRDNALMWSLPSDLKRFKQLTVGKPIVMGRRTFESIGHPLPLRTNIVLSHDPDFAPEGCTVVGSLEEALEAAGAAPEVVIIGGSEVFNDVIDKIDRIHLTRVHATFEADRFFPMLQSEEWDEAWSEYHEPDEKHEQAYTFSTLERKR
ncbi:MAG TPA: dihydrofolate reductase [Candidatus Xenobia bacterium]|jgi:dihydrofolate reductase